MEIFRSALQTGLEYSPIWINGLSAAAAVMAARFWYSSAVAGQNGDEFTARTHNWHAAYWAVVAAAAQAAVSVHDALHHAAPNWVL